MDRWAVQISSEGTKYYFNASTGETTWTAPPGFESSDSSDSSDSGSGSSSSSDDEPEPGTPRGRVIVDGSELALPSKEHVWLAATDSATGRSIYVNKRGEKSGRRPTVAMYHTDGSDMPYYYNRRDGTTTWEEPVHRAPDPRRSSVSLAARRSSMRRTSSMDFASASPRSRANTGLSRHGSIDEMVDEDDESGSSSDESSSGSGGESSSEGDDESGSSSSSSSSSDEGAPAAAAAAPARSVFSSIAGQSPVERARARFEVTDAALVGRFGLSKKKKKKTKKKKHRSATGRQRIERARARHKQLDAERRGGGARARTVVIHASGSSSSSSRLKDKKKPTRLNGGARNSLFKRVMAGGSGAKPPPPTSAPPPRRISSFGGGAPPAPPAPSGFRRPSVSHAAIHEARLRASSRT